MGWGWSEEASWINCCLSQNLKMSRREPDGEEEGEEDSGLTLAFMPRHASVGSYVTTLPWDAFHTLLYPHPLPLCLLNSLLVILSFRGQVSPPSDVLPQSEQAKVLCSGSL